jgi:hypothetical protein
MRFCTVINCMDGRTQLPVIGYLQKRFNVEYVDSITEAGPNLILAEKKPSVLVQAILERVRISVEKHESVGIAIVGHYDCAGNPSQYDEQVGHVGKSVKFLRSRYGSTRVIGLWVDSNWKVQEIVSEGDVVE